MTNKPIKIVDLIPRAKQAGQEDFNDAFPMEASASAKLIEIISLRDIGHGATEAPLTSAWGEGWYEAQEEWESQGRPNIGTEVVTAAEPGQRENGSEDPAPATGIANVIAKSCSTFKKADGDNFELMLNVVAQVQLPTAEKVGILFNASYSGQTLYLGDLVCYLSTLRCRTAPDKKGHRGMVRKGEKTVLATLVFAPTSSDVHKIWVMIRDSGLVNLREAQGRLDFSGTVESDQVHQPALAGVGAES